MPGTGGPAEGNDGNRRARRGQCREPEGPPRAMTGTGGPAEGNDGCVQPEMTQSANLDIILDASDYHYLARAAWESSNSTPCCVRSPAVVSSSFRGFPVPAARTPVR